MLRNGAEQCEAIAYPVGLSTEVGGVSAERRGLRNDRAFSRIDPDELVIDADGAMWPLLSGTYHLAAVLCGCDARVKTFTGRC